MSDCKELYYDKDRGRFEWIGGRYPPALEAETSAFSYDVPWLEFYGLTPDELCKRWNNHERLVEALRECERELAKLINGNDISDGSMMAEMQARALLADLEAEKGGEL